MQEHKYQAREKPVREIEREEKTKIRQEGKGLARDRPIEKVLLEKNITDKAGSFSRTKKKETKHVEKLCEPQRRRRRWKVYQRTCYHFRAGEESGRREWKGRIIRTFSPHGKFSGKSKEPIFRE